MQMTLKSGIHSTEMGFVSNRRDSDNQYDVQWNRSDGRQGVSGTGKLKGGVGRSRMVPSSFCQFPGEVSSPAAVPSPLMVNSEPQVLEGGPDF